MSPNVSELVVCGPPEDVQAFRITHDQAFGRLLGEHADDIARPLIDPAARGLQRLLVQRRSTEHRALNETYWSKGVMRPFAVVDAFDPGTLRLPDGCLPFPRGLRLRFVHDEDLDPNWAPVHLPRMRNLAASHPTLAFTLSAGRDFIRAAGGDVHEVAQAPNGSATLAARRDLPAHQRATPIVAAVWRDDVQALGRCLKGRSVAEHIVNSPWTLLQHAAFAGSLQVARFLLREGCDPLRRSVFGVEQTIGLNDICLAVDSGQPAALVRRRQGVFLAALAQAPALAAQPLANGHPALSLAIIARMGPLVAGLAQTAAARDFSGPLCSGRVAADFAQGFDLETLDTFFADAPHAAGFGKALAAPLLQSQDSPNEGLRPASTLRAAGLFAVLCKRGFVNEAQKLAATGCAMANGAAELAFGVSGEFAAAVAAHLARDEIEAALSKVTVPQRAPATGTTSMRLRR